MYVTNIVVDSVLSVSSFQDLILYSFPRRDIQTRPSIPRFGFPERKRREKGIIFEKTLKNLRFGSNGIRARVSNVIIGQ